MSQIDPNDDDAMDPNMADMDPEQFEDWGDQPVEQRAWAGHPRPPIRPPVGGWQPGFRPPPGWGPGPGKWPYWGMWGYRMLSAWRDIKFLKRLVGEIVQDDILKAIEAGIIAPGPNSPVPGPGGGPGAVIVSPTPPANPSIGQLWYDTTTGQVKFWDGTDWEPLSVMQGVTDGSDAQPGQVGEFVRLVATGTVSTQQGVGTGTSIPVGILQAGDWDVEASITIGDFSSGAGVSVDAVHGASLELKPTPTGFADNLLSFFYLDTLGGQTIAAISLTTPTTRASLATPTLLPFWFGYNESNVVAGLAGGPYTLTCTARRMR